MKHELLNQDAWRHPLFTGGAMVGDSIYLVRQDRSGIFRWEKEDNQLKLLHIDAEYVNRSYVYGDCVYADGGLYCVPCNSDAMLVFDLKNKWEQFSLDLSMCNGKNTARFSGGVYADRCIWLVPKSSYSIAFFDMDEKKFHYIEDFYDAISSYLDKTWGHIVRTETYGLGSIWMLLWESHVVVQFHLKTFTIRVHSVGEKGELFRNIEFAEEKLWISTQYGDVFSWNPDNGKRESLRMGNGKEIGFKIIGKTIYIFPVGEHKYTKVDISKSMQSICDVTLQEDNLPLMPLVRFGEQFLYVMPTKDRHYITCLDSDTCDIRKFDLKISDEDMLCYQNVFLEHGEMSENTCNLNGMMDCLKNDLFNKGEANLSCRDVGKEIYHQIIGE